MRLRAAAAEIGRAEATSLTAPYEENEGIGFARFAPALAARLFVSGRQRKTTTLETHQDIREDRRAFQRAANSFVARSRVNDVLHDSTQMKRIGAPLGV
jgi:hypothetical protein